MNRRKLLKQSLVVSSLTGASVWRTPLVNAIVLPAHAQTSCSFVASRIFQITGQQGFDFVVLNECSEGVTDSLLSSADLFIELVNTQIMGTVRAVEITMNYSQNVIPINQSFLPDTQSGNTPFVIPLDNLPPNNEVRLELNYFESTDTLEVRILLN